ncbi:conserved hypothetical protein [Gluconacetobacter diazotrophicus PA1 5]|uniref:hypothetical protein n=1 Tax=Gluconacetobacter diazotrophicus TaxID=33996 RepID=UPI000173C11F|nr:hypothetical protein [Gluconacetobacter diazotrophicus]ACI51983.1 conserved hypothetical protein [Gluconacetobacter diazotrophicus PA1 5]TWB05176.1 hypothetical protein FBZ86_1175 [Gluconacetobacter diazotrophicus]
MQDPYWHDAWVAAQRHVGRDDRLLLPRGDWPGGAAGDIRCYDDAIDLGDATIFFLHKGRMGCIDRSALRQVFRTWHIFHANEVFICFRKRRPFLPLFRGMAHSRHVGVLTRYLDSGRRKRTDRTMFFVHLPKTAGTSAWRAMAAHVPSKIYYEMYSAFIANPPAAGEYDLVGGHIPLRVMEPRIRPDDVVTCLFREPVSRFRSAFLHSRRPDEDPATFTPVMRAMRDMPLREFLKRPDARMEVSQQSLMLGFSFREHYQESLDGDIFDSIRQYLRHPLHVFMTSDAIEPFVNRTVGLLRSRPGMVKRHNSSDIVRQQADVAEFEDCLEEVKALGALDAAVYRLIRAQQARVLHPARAS